MAGFPELEGPEIGLPPMSSEWPTACSRNTGMFWRMKRPKRNREAVCRCSGPRFPSERSQSLVQSTQPKEGPKDMTRHVLAAWKVDIENRVKGIERLGVWRSAPDRPVKNGDSEHLRG